MFAGKSFQGETEIMVRDRLTISDYLYYLESSNNSKQNEKVNPQ